MYLCGNNTNAMYESLRGNKNAEKYSKDVVIQMLTKILEQAKTGECYLIIHAIDGITTLDNYEYLKVKYKEDKTVLDITKEIERTTENNLTKQMLQGKIKETASIFLLKSKYGYIDKQQIEHEHKGSININLQFPE